MTASDNIIASTAQLPTFYSLISRAAHLHRNRIALRFRTQTYTYAELISLTNQLTKLLHDEGARAETVVAVILDRSPDMVITLLAILRSGAAYLPIDPAYPKDLIDYMLNDSAAAILITSRKYRDAYNTTAKELYIEGCRERMPAYSGDDEPAPGIEGHNLAYILYTSGSTGRPKGVQIEQHSLLNFLTSMQLLLNVTPVDRLLAITTISFDIAGLELFLPLISGAELVLADKTAAKDARMLLEIIGMENITVMQATPSTWKMMLSAGWDTPLPLRILCGGELMTKALADSLTQKASKVWNVYGPTETTIWSTIKDIHSDTDPITIGSPIANTQVYILDPHQKPVRQGQTGEIYIAGEGVARGYLNLPALTAERFLGHPRMYRTGDLGSWLPNGDIQLHGRIDGQLKIRGYRIEPGEIETALLGHPNIRDAVVTGKGDELLAYIIPKEAPAGDSFKRDIRRFLKTRLPEHMLPQHIIVMDAFPLTPNGKIARNKLPEPSTQSSAYVVPETNLQKLVAEIWASCLHKGQVGLHDDYFELGGTSIIALQIMTKLEKITGKRLPLSTLFQASTVARLAALLGSDNPGISWEPLVLIKPGTTMPALYLVQGYDMNVLGFNNLARHLPAQLPVYGFQAKGLNGIDQPHDSIESMAADYVDAMLQRDTKGPFYLAGYSYGGVVAFEMAQQLIAKGKKVAMLAIIDTYANNWQDHMEWKTRIRRKTLRQVKKFKFILTNLQKYPANTLKYQFDFLARKARSVIGLFRRPSNIPLTAEERVDEQYDLACRNYRLQIYDGDIDLFRVKTRLYFLDDLEYMGWKTFVKKHITVHEVPGDHKTFLLPPNDKTFAAILEQVIGSKTAS